jgi:hypothetical protein
MKSGIQQKICETVLECSEYNAQEKSVAIKFLTPEIAAAVMGLKGFHFVCNILSVETFVAPLTEPEDQKLCAIDANVVDDRVETYAHPQAVPEDHQLSAVDANVVDRDLVMPPKGNSVHMSSKTINIFNLPENFEESMLLYELNKCFYKDKFCDRSVKPAIGCEKTGLTSAIAEFVSVEAACRVFELNTAEYEGQSLTLELVQTPSETENAIPLLEITKKINISGLPIGCEDSILLYELNKCLYKDKFCDRSDKPAIGCEKAGPTSAIAEVCLLT